MQRTKLQRLRCVLSSQEFDQASLDIVRKAVSHLQRAPGNSLYRNAQSSTLLHPTMGRYARQQVHATARMHGLSSQQC